jgi:hypothetical protein
MMMASRISRCLWATLTKTDEWQAQIVVQMKDDDEVKDVLQSLAYGEKPSSILGDYMRPRMWYIASLVISTNH